MKPVLRPTNKKTLAARSRYQNGGEPSQSDLPQQAESTTAKQPAKPKLPIPRKYLVYTAGPIAVVSLLAWAFRPVPTLVDLGTVERGELQVTINAKGKTRVRDRFTISAPGGFRRKWFWRSIG
jgi:HlyD family secretion protein